MSIGNIAPHLVCQRVQHAVMWVNRREPVILQLISNNGDQLLHARVIVSPVTDDLQK